MSQTSVGASTVGQDASEAIADIPRNRTLFVQQLTASPSAKPVVVDGIKNINDAFEHFQPSVDVEFKKADGSLTEETLAFNSVSDFNPDKIKLQSALLKDLSTQQELYARITKQLRNNKLLGTVLSKEETKQAMLDAIRGLIQEIKDANQNK
jgi:predicted component of type VI protein secretion system